MTEVDETKKGQIIMEKEHTFVGFEIKRCGSQSTSKPGSVGSSAGGVMSPPVLEISVYSMT